jgi:hypothetical protein
MVWAPYPFAVVRGGHAGEFSTLVLLVNGPEGRCVRTRRPYLTIRVARFTQQSRISNSG